MATIRNLREEAGLTVSELARRANVDYKTAKKADDSAGSIHRLKALALLRVLNQVLNTQYTPDQIESLATH